jgi:uncharacterized protein
MTAGLHYVAFPTLHDAPITLAARLRIPEGASEPLPAVVILHGSAGPSAREGGYADALNAAGIATLEPDQWSARGLAGGARGRPRTVAETLPDLFGARRFLARDPRIDATRIGAMGFSFGGVAMMLATTKAYSERYSPDGTFAALMPCYPICWLYGNVPGIEFANLVNTPVFLLTAALDQYDNDPRAGEKLVSSLSEADKSKVRTRAMADCHHGFDMPGVDLLAEDPSSNRGAGGTAIMRYNAAATVEAHKLAAEFFSAALNRQAITIREVL